MKIRKTILSALFLALSGTASAQIPTIDTAAIAQMVTTVEQLKAQLAQMQQTYSNFTGSRGLGTVANNTALRNYIPANWQSTYDSIRSGGYSGLTDTAKLIRQANMIFDACASQTGQSKTICERQSVLAAQQKAYINSAFEAAGNRLVQIEQLMSRINSTTDQKEIAELQARIGTEQAAIQNEMTKMQLFRQAAEIEEKLAQQQHTEQVQQMMTSTGDDLRSFARSY